MFSLPLSSIKEKVLSGGRLDACDGLRLFESDDIFTLGEMAFFVQKKKNGNRAYFIRNLHINPTNICINRCRFCAFSRSMGQEGAFELSIGDILKNIREAMPVGEVHIVGGLHPDWPFSRYLEILSAIRGSFPSVHIKAFTATEVDYFSSISGLTVGEGLLSLKKSGLGS